ncbi:universal stress protein [Profundibacter amoris]|uniref:Universal stress protein n=1 Tax=Profundibacter amoris TaxID=2171755 RepID=A0A347UJD7_9RHOB|nr:universal stress protein [Profundibacter amoris]AXX98965.1 universal stress protein [Profundibacter amoris]
MTYKTLLTVITDPTIAKPALDRAVAIAHAEEAHLDVLCIGVDRTQTGYYYAGASAVFQQEVIEKAKEEAVAAETYANEHLANEGIPFAVDKAVAQLAGLGRLVAHRARFSDLVVLPRPYGKGCGQEQETIVESTLFEGQVPTLVVPPKTKANVEAKCIIIAWNESTEAMAAVRAALPALIAADSVNITVIDPPQHGPDRSDPGGALSQMLVRHGVKAEITVLAKTMPRVSDVLLRHARDINADMIVMGAYGHSRFREAILGGATRNMLENTKIPVLMAH